MPHNILTNKDYYTSIYLVNDELQYMLADAPAGATVGQMPGQVLPVVEGGATPYKKPPGMGPKRIANVTVTGLPPGKKTNAPIGTPNSPAPIIHEVRPPVGHAGQFIQIVGENFFQNGIGGTTADIQVEFWYGYHPGFPYVAQFDEEGTECPVRWWPVAWGPYTTPKAGKKQLPNIIDNWGYGGDSKDENTLYGGSNEGAWSWPAAPKLINSTLIELRVPDIEPHLYMSPTPQLWYNYKNPEIGGLPSPIPGVPWGTAECKAPAWTELAKMRVAYINVYYLDTTGHRHDVTTIVSTPEGGFGASIGGYGNYQPGISTGQDVMGKTQQLAGKGMMQNLPEFRYLDKYVIMD